MLGSNNGFHHIIVQRGFIKMIEEDIHILCVFHYLLSQVNVLRLLSSVSR